MQTPTTSSRRRFGEYLKDQERRRKAGEFHPRFDKESPDAARARRHRRSFAGLVVAFLGLLSDQKGAIALTLLLATFSTLLGLLPPLATKLAIDYVLVDRPLPGLALLGLDPPPSQMGMLWLVAAAIMAVTLADSIVGLAGRYLATRATKRLQVTVKRRTFDHAVQLPLHRVYELKSGGVTSILREDAGGVGELVFSLVYTPWRAVVQLIGSVAILAWVDWRLLLASLFIVPLVYISHETWTFRLRPLHRDIRLRRQEIDGQATEAFGGMRVVRAFDRRRSESGRFTRANHLLARQEFHAWWWARGVDLVWELVVPCASAGLLLYGGSRVIGGQLSLGDLVMFLIYLSMLLAPISVLANSATSVQSALAGLERVLDLLAEPTELPTRPGATSLVKERVRGRITVDSVSFHYPGGAEPVLADISIDVKPGQRVALVGPSGAGKTTLCNLIARFYDPTEGAIKLDGVDLRDLEAGSYRRLFGIVEQEVFLFDGTVAENIGYASRTPDREALEHAARVANADSFIRELPNGYETIIGERGVRLSGGQRQRIAIARAILADPRILILDEATSNLDTESERAIQEALAGLMRGRTAFVIAHRLSTIVHADLILVMENGRIVERGSHDQLLAQSGRYRQMVELQMSPDQAFARS